MQITVIGFYKIKKINKPEKYQDNLKKYFLNRSVRGTVILSPEGVNGTISGLKNDVNNCLNYIKKKLFIKKFDSDNYSKIHFQPFYRPKIKIKKEVIPIGLTLNSNKKKKPQYIEPKKWNEFILNKDLAIIDVRKPIEFKLGTFKNAINPNVKNFRQFPDFFKKLKKNKKIAMFCTGGIRCEKAASYLRKKGFKEIYQLKGGILNYLNNINKKNSFWEGECFVFDNRVSLKHKLILGTYTMCSACRTPVSPKEKKSKKYIEDISCPNCFDKLSEIQKERFLMRKKQKEVLKGNTNIDANK